MAKIRINKLALELNVQYDQIIDVLHKKGIAVKNYMSSIDEDTANTIRDLFNPQAAAAKTKVAKTKIAATKAKSAPLKAGTSARAKTKILKRVKPPEPEKKEEPKTAVKTTAKKKTDVAAKTEKKETPVKTAAKTAKTKKAKEAVEEKAPKKHGLKIVKKEEKPKEAEKKSKPQKKSAPEKPKADKAKPAEKAPVAAKVLQPSPAEQVEEETFETVQLSPNIHVRDLAEKLKCSPNEIIKELMTFGLMATINQSPRSRCRQQSRGPAGI